MKWDIIRVVFERFRGKSGMWICRDVCWKEGFAKTGKCDSKTVNGWSETRAGDPEQLGITSQRLQDVFEGRNGSRIDVSARNGLI